MMKKIIILLTMLILAANLVSAAGFDDILNEIEGQKLPGPVSALFNNQNINIELTLVDGSVTTYGIVTKSSKVQTAQVGALDSPTLIVKTTEATVTKIQDSDNQLATLQASLKDGSISYTAVGFVNKVKFGMSSFFVKIASLFSSNKESTVLEDTADEDKKEDLKGSVETEDKEEIKEDEKPEKEVEVEILESDEDLANPTVEITKKGFDPKEITVKVGETVTWKNVRSGSLNKAMIIGTGGCISAKSGLLFPEETYSYKFDRAMRCTIVDGFTTTTVSTVIVE